MFVGDTICAPACPAGGAISIIRLSGPDSLPVLDKLVRFRNGRAVTSLEANTVRFGDFVAADGSVVDEVLVSVFRAPHSYTGEDSAEISCHASPFIIREIMSELVRAGVRAAEPGEFTRRAFVNGKMDLAQAEAVADVIASESRSSHRVALNQLKGGYSKKLEIMRSKLLDITSLMELELDFSEEDVEFADRTSLKSLLGELIELVDGLASSFRLGNAVRNGVPVAIVGPVNAGKSTLLNALVGDERAIVSDVPGTTRDTVEETFVIGGHLFRFIDTAGIRETSETVEKLGIGRTFDKIEKAEIVLYVVDSAGLEGGTGAPGSPAAGNPASGLEPGAFAAGTAAIPAGINEVLSKVDLSRQKFIVLLNKADVSGVDAGHLGSSASKMLDNIFVNSSVTVGKSSESSGNPVEWLPISAKTGLGLDELKVKLQIIQDNRISQSDTLVTNIRHFEALTKASGLLKSALTSLSSGIPADLVSQDLREAAHHLGTITGQISTDEVLGNIFERFCIGK